MPQFARSLTPEGIAMFSEVLGNRVQFIAPDIFGSQPIPKREAMELAERGVDVLMLPKPRAIGFTAE